MSIIKFDKFDRYEIPVLTLANPNDKELGQISQFKNLTCDLGFNMLSTLNFDYLYNVEDVMYNEIQERRIIKTEDLGNYIITKVEEKSNGISKYLQVECASLEYELNGKKVNLFKGVYKFYDFLNPQKTLLGKLIEKMPNWKIGYVTTELTTKSRYFDISDGTIYGFLMNDVEMAYECIFEFDTYTRTINAYTPEDILRPTDLYVSFNNIMKDKSVKANADNLYTAVSCFGGNGLSIAGVNPIGGTTIYNFDYFEQWMSDSLKQSLNNWKQLFKEQQPIYSDLLMNYRAENVKLVKAKTELKDLKAELNRQSNNQSEYIADNNTKSNEYSNVYNSVSSLQVQINSKENEINTLQTTINNIQLQIKLINDKLSFKNFSEEDYKELNKYIYETTYQDDSFIETSIMTPVEIQDMQQSLYNQGVKLLRKISKPIYNIEINAVNFLLIKEFQEIVNALDYNRNETIKQILGVTFNLEMDNDEYIQPVLLKFHLNFDNPKDFTMSFGNRYRLSDPNWDFNSLYGESVKTSSNMSFNFSGLKDWESYQNELIDFANSSLDMTKNELVNDANNIQMEINETGLIAKRFNNDKSNYLGEQLWMTHNVIAFTKDKFETVETAVGRIPLVDGGYSYGINAQILLGKAIFGANLTIANETNTMTIDGNGLEMITNNQASKIILDPNRGIKIQGNAQGVFEDKLYMDLDGNLIINGKINASEGDIGGWEIRQDGLYSTYGDYISSEGYGKIGLMTYTPTSASFNGNIYAKNLDEGGITTNKIRNGAVTSAKLDTVYATQASFNSLKATVAEIDRAYISEVTADRLYASKSQFNSLETTVAEINSAYIKKVTADNLYASKSQFNSLETKVAKIENAYITEAKAKQIFADFINSVKSISTDDMNIRERLAFREIQFFAHYNSSEGRYYIASAKGAKSVNLMSEENESQI